MTQTTATFEELSRRFQRDLQERLPGHIARMGWDSDEIAAYQREQLRALLAHAIAKSPFHAERLAGLVPERFELEDLTSLPVMTKAQTMASFEEVVTDRRLTRSSVDAYVAVAGDRPDLLADEYVCITSGGSSGLRGLFVYNWEAFVDVTLAVLRPSLARMMGSGGPPVIGLVAAPTAIHMTRAASVLFNGGPVRVVSAPATLPLEEIVARLNRGEPNLLIGYASSIRLLAAEKDAGRLSIAPVSVATTSDQLTAEAAAAITGAFGVPVTNMFGSSEGLIGSSAPGHETLTFASDLAIVELVDENNQPVEPGQPSAKVLLTNLCNLAQPLIRYEMEDSFVRQPDSPDHGHLCATVEGRSDEVLVYNDRRIHPLVIRSSLNRNASVLEYQVRQTHEGIDVRVVASGPLDEEQLRAALIASLEAAGLSGARVNLQTVPSLERHPQTGKVKRFVPLA